jgi:diaminopimelate epimerase
VELDGGELTVEITEDLDLTLIGRASRVYRGELDPELVRALEG